MNRSQINRLAIWRHGRRHGAAGAQTLIGSQLPSSMDVAIAIGSATTGLTLLVTVSLFAIDRVLTRRAQLIEVRRLLIVRVLDALDASTRSMIRPAFVTAWNNPDLEFALLAPRLYLDLEQSDRAVAMWVQRQVQRMQLAAGGREALLIRATVADHLIRWHLGEIDTSDFTEMNLRDPMARDFRVPWNTKLRRMSRDSWRWTQFFGVAAAGAFAFRGLLKK
jgi:hypothetical protein